MSGRRLEPPPEPTRDRGLQDLNMGDEDFAGLRPYRRGDPPRHIHWKTYAREQGLHVKLFTGTGVTTQYFDFDLLPAGMDVEDRLSQLCRWILDADIEAHNYGLRLPDQDPAPCTRRCT